MFTEINMSNSSQTQAESSSVRPDAPPLINLEDTERTSSPSSLEHKSTTTSPTNSPTRDFKGKGKAVEVTDVNEDEEDQGLATPSAPTVAGIEPEVSLDSGASAPETGTEKQLGQNQPGGVSEIEWKDESSKNNAYVEGYNDAIHDVREEFKRYHCTHRHRQPCHRGRCQPQAHRQTTNTDSESGAWDIHSEADFSTQQSSSEQESLDNSSGESWRPKEELNHDQPCGKCLKCGGCRSRQTPKQESRSRRNSAQATTREDPRAVAIVAAIRGILGKPNADRDQIDRDLRPLESLLATDFPNHPLLACLARDPELEREEQLQEDLFQERNAQRFRRADHRELARLQAEARERQRQTHRAERARESQEAPPTARRVPRLPVPTFPISSGAPVPEGSRTDGFGFSTTTPIFLPPGFAANGQGFPIFIPPILQDYLQRPAQTIDLRPLNASLPVTAGRRTQTGSNRAGSSQGGSSRAGYSQSRGSQAGSSQVRGNSGRSRGHRGPSKV